MSELPGLPLIAAQALARYPAQVPEWEHMLVCPSVLASSARMNLDHLLRLLIGTDGAPFYVGLGLVGQWCPDDGLLLVTKSH